MYPAYPSSKSFASLFLRNQPVHIEHVNCLENIARGMTDPEIDSVTWTKFSDHKDWSTDGGLALVRNLATR